MTDLELTDWFHGLVRPMRMGVYECISQGGIKMFKRWDGGRWRAAFHTEDPADDNYWPYMPPVRWRGLTKESK